MPKHLQKTSTRRHIPATCRKYVKMMKRRITQRQLRRRIQNGFTKPITQIRYYLLRRVYSVLSSNEWEIRFACVLNKTIMHKHSNEWKSVHGFIDDYNETQTIFLDPRTDILATLVHEVLHIIYPDASESTVRDMEYLIISGLTPCQAKRLLSLLQIYLV